MAVLKHEDESTDERKAIITRVIRDIYPPEGTSGVRPKPHLLAEQIVAALDAAEADDA